MIIVMSNNRVMITLILKITMTKMIKIITITIMNMVPMIMNKKILIIVMIA